VQLIFVHSKVCVCYQKNKKEQERPVVVGSYDLDVILTLHKGGLFKEKVRIFEGQGFCNWMKRDYTKREHCVRDGRLLDTSYIVYGQYTP